MNRDEKKFLKEDIADINSLNRDEFLLMIKYCLEAYIKSLIIFGKNSPVTQDVFNVWKEYLNINCERKKIVKFLLKNSKVIDNEEANEILMSIEDLNEKTVLYYYRVLDDILDACDCNDVYRAQRINKDFDTLIETDNYCAQVTGLIMNLEDIKKFLGYPNAFWQYVDNKIVFVDSHKEGNDKFYSTLMRFDKNNCLIDIKVIVPYIINLQTALVNIHEFKHAYDLYNLLGQSIDEKAPIYEQSARDVEKVFVKEYIIKKFKSKK